jgi:hypothetical protein
VRKPARGDGASSSVGAHPDVEIEVHGGDQPLYPYLVGVE